jgi:hypothetical protein
MEKLGARVERTASRTVIEGPRQLDCEIRRPVDMTQHAGRRRPTLMMIAPFLETPTRITGLATLRVKECDRIAAPTRELRKLGVQVEEGPDYMVVEPLGAAVKSRPRSSKSRPTTITVLPCRLACSDRCCRGSGFSIPAAWRKPTRTIGRTGASQKRPAPVT